MQLVQKKERSAKCQIATGLVRKICFSNQNDLVNILPTFYRAFLQEFKMKTAFEFTPTLLVNKFSWSYHKVALDLWGSRIWLNVSIFYQFHKAKSRYLSSEPGHWFKKQLSKFSWNQSKDLTFAQIFAFCDLNVIFDNSNWIECVYILKFQIGVNSKAVGLTQNNFCLCKFFQ